MHSPDQWSLITPMMDLGSFNVMKNQHYILGKESENCYLAEGLLTHYDFGLV